jgi:hypothetical protein
MRAKQLIQNSTYGPEKLKLLSEAFEAAQDRVVAKFGPESSAIEVARLRLASMLLLLGNSDVADPAVLKDRALEALEWSA